MLFKYRCARVTSYRRKNQFRARHESAERDIRCSNLRQRNLRQRNELWFRLGRRKGRDALAGSDLRTVWEQERKSRSANRRVGELIPLLKTDKHGHTPTTPQPDVKRWGASWRNLPFSLYAFLSPICKHLVEMLCIVMRKKGRVAIISPPPSRGQLRPVPYRSLSFSGSPGFWTLSGFCCSRCMDERRTIKRLWYSTLVTAPASCSRDNPPCRVMVL